MIIAHYYLLIILYHSCQTFFYIHIKNCQISSNTINGIKEIYQQTVQAQVHSPQVIMVCTESKVQANFAYFCIRPILQQISHIVYFENISKNSPVRLLEALPRLVNSGYFIKLKKKKHAHTRDFERNTFQIQNSCAILVLFLFLECRRSLV